MIMEKNTIDEDRFLFLSEAEIFLRQNKFSEVLAIAQARLQQRPLDIDARVAAANALIGMKKAGEITNILQETEKTIADFSVVYLRLGDICRENSLFREAAVCYKKYIFLNPEAEKTKEAIEKIVLLEREEPMLAQEEETCGGSDDGPEFQTITLADLYIRQGHFSVAAEILQKIIQREPENKLAKTKLDTVNTAIALQAAAKNNSSPADILIEAMTRWLENLDKLK